MNLSGNFVQEIARYYKINTEDILVIYDDMDHPIGKFSIRKSGNSGGQNGIKDIMLKMHTPNINRLKIGIGRSTVGTEHVLGKFTLDEKVKMKTTLRSVLDAAKTFLDHDIEYVMNKYNRKT